MSLFRHEYHFPTLIVMQFSKKLEFVNAFTKLEREEEKNIYGC